MNNVTAEDCVERGYKEANLGKHDEAIKCFDKAIAIDPNHAGAWAGRGNVFVNLGKHDEAIKCFDKAIAIDPN
ncbi:MAG: tetratricopeptide repeat protein, partial [Nitrososphaerales archaeon]